MTRLYEPEGGKAVDPRRILLVTFTDNAAAELRTRVTQLVLKARYEAKDDPARSGAGPTRSARDLPTTRGGAKRRR